MTLDEFRSLCEKEWSTCRGEIVTLWLTQESYSELQQHATEYPVFYKENGGAYAASRLVYNQTGDSAVQVSMGLNAITNPVTKNPVRMKLARDKDVADIFNGKTRQMYSVVL
jgi:hypothetical protein